MPRFCRGSDHVSVIFCYRLALRKQATPFTMVAILHAIGLGSGWVFFSGFIARIGCPFSGWRAAAAMHSLAVLAKRTGIMVNGGMGIREIFVDPKFRCDVGLRLHGSCFSFDSDGWLRRKGAAEERAAAAPVFLFWYYQRSRSKNDNTGRKTPKIAANSLSRLIHFSIRFLSFFICLKSLLSCLTAFFNFLISEDCLSGSVVSYGSL